MIIYVGTVRLTWKIYKWLLLSLKLRGYADGVKSYRSRIVAIVNGCTDLQTKQDVTARFTTDSPVRIVVATTAFCMRVHIPDVVYTVNWGVPSSAMYYWQQACRYGRDGRSAASVLYAFKSSVKTCQDAKMWEVVAVNGCYRCAALESFVVDNTTVASTHTCSSNAQCWASTCCTYCFQNCRCSGKRNDLLSIIA